MRFGSQRDYRSLDLRLELLPLSDLCSILRSGTSHTMMMLKANSHTFLAETATAVPALPCLHRSDAIRRPGSVVALAGSSLR
jgi:hypothetical protein